MEGVIIGWVSGGGTSAVACKIALQMYDNVELYYIDTGSHHKDNYRFLSELETWYNKPINTIKSNKYEDVFSVIRKGFINSPHGAACTSELKKKVRYELEDKIGSWGGQIWGFEFSPKEINRAIRFKEQHPHTKPLFPLIERQITKEQAHYILKENNIELPMMYRLGYNNNNCIGCVKGGMGYWNKIRIDFPEFFNETAKIEREINATCLKDDKGKVFLDELDPNRGDFPSEIMPECGLFCQLEVEDLIDRNVDKIIKGEISINDI